MHKRGPWLGEEKTVQDIEFFFDASHGWYQVYVEQLKELGIADKISPYSYVSRSGVYAYLEEDSDASLFFKTLEKHGITPNVRENDHGDHSMIRKMKRYKNK